jgi:ADP-heptose:LPS heptosyltransferase
VRGFLRYRSRWTRYPGWMANASMLRRPGSPEYGSGHAIENNLAMGWALGIEPATHRLSLPHLQPELSARENLILIHPGASRENKRWPVENWAALADELAARFHCAIALTGDRSEHSLCARVAAAMRTRAQVMAGKFSLTELAKVQSYTLAFLSGDTGPYHLAVAVGCPTLTLFAPTDRGSSTEACGPHQAPPELHRTLQTARYGDSIHTLSLARVQAEAIAVIEAALAAQPTEPSA